jgi:hypothetical protein
LPIEEKENGVYTMNLKEKWVRTIDKDGNSFEINSDGETRTFISVSFNLKQDRTKWDSTPRFKGPEYLDPVNMNLPKPKNWKDPIIFIINGDNTGVQLLTESMLSNYWMERKNSKCSIVSLDEGITKSTGIMVLEEKREGKMVDMVNPEVPPIFKKRPVSRFPSNVPGKKTFISRVLRKFDKVQDEDRKNIKAYAEKHVAWVQHKVTQNENIGIFERCDEELDEELNFQQKMLTLGSKSIVVFNSSNIAEITNKTNVKLMDDPIAEEVI